MHKLLNKIAAIVIFAIRRALMTPIQVAEAANFMDCSEGEEF